MTDKAIANSAETPDPIYATGTKVVSINGEMDYGEMSWDNDGHEVHRMTGGKAVGEIDSVSHYDENGGWNYNVIFELSEVWVVLDEKELQDTAEYAVLVDDEPFRDPYVLKQIETGIDPSRMSTYLAAHQHEHGVDTYAFRANRIPSDEEVAKLLNINFEPRRDEVLDVFEIPERRLPELTLPEVN